MEESEKRRERLKAMRMEATQVELNNNAPEPLKSGGLSNPLIESETITTAPSGINSSRFDFYTDPMAAFSGNKRRNNISPQVAQGNYNIPPRTPFQGMAPGPVHQNLAINFPHQRPFQAPATHFNPGPPRSPMETAGPFGRPQVSPQQLGGGPGSNFYSTSPNFYRGSNFASRSFEHGDQGPSRSRMEGSSPFGRPPGNPPAWDHGTPRSRMEGSSSFGRPLGNPPAWDYSTPRSQMEGVGPLSRPQGSPVPPGAWGRSESTINYRTPPNICSGNNFTSSSFGHGNSPVSCSRGGGQRYDSSSQYRPSHGGSHFTDSGRGRGQHWNAGSGSGGRRGGRSHGSVSAELRPDLYYKKEMVEDPWRGLSPVTWKGVELEEGDSKQSWLPESIRKKGKVSPEFLNTSVHRPSLAEYLAASFNDSTNEPEPEPEPVPVPVPVPEQGT